MFINNKKQLKESVLGSLTTTQIHNTRQAGLAVERFPSSQASVSCELAMVLSCSDFFLSVVLTNHHINLKKEKKLNVTVIYISVTITVSPLFHTNIFFF